MERLNRASVEDLEKIEGIGRKRAEDIVQFRDEQGGFKNIDDLKRVPGFTDEMVDNIRNNGGD